MSCLADETMRLPGRLVVVAILLTGREITVLRDSGLELDRRMLYPPAVLPLLLSSPNRDSPLPAAYPLPAPSLVPSLVVPRIPPLCVPFVPIDDRRVPIKLLREYTLPRVILPRLWPTLNDCRVNPLVVPRCC